MHQSNDSTEQAPSWKLVSTEELHRHTCQWEILQPKATTSSRQVLNRRSEFWVYYYYYYFTLG